MASVKNRFIYIFFTLTAVFCGLIWSITNLGYDGEYQLAMSYRLLKGDKMFLEMWEPNQTSAFLPAALMWIYMKLLHTTTGIVLYLQICGILIRGAIAYLLYRMLNADLDKPLAYGMALFYFMISPKDYSLPEYSNLQLWYSSLLFCCLLTYLKKQKPYLLVLSAIWLCLEVLAYPSCAIVLLGVMLILALYSTHKWRDILIITWICGGLGLIFLCYILCTTGPEIFMECISGMLSLEPTHTVSAITKLSNYLKDGFKIVLLLSAAGILGFVISLIPLHIFGKKAAPHVRSGWWLLCSALLLLAGFLLNILSAENRCAYGIIFLALIGAGFQSSNALKGREKQIYVCGNIIGGLGFLATLILSDLPFTSSIPYGLLAAIVALIPIRKQLDKLSFAPIRKAFHYCFLCFMALLVFRCIYIRIPLSGKGQICSILSEMSIVRTGPAAGLISNEEGVCIQRDSYPEWKEYIPPGSKVWIIGGVVDTLGYLYEDVEVAGPSTMSTPSYNDAILEYWKLNPDKYPDVIIAEGYLGEISYELASNPWLLSWIEEDYQPEYVIGGKYWNYYFRKTPQNSR